jgi:hypothetical protein
MFIQLHSDMLALVKGKDKINLRISHSSFVKPIIYPFMNRSDFANKNLENTFFGVIQSYRTINVSEQNPLKLNVCLARLPSGAGGRKKNKIHPDLTSYRNAGDHKGGTHASPCAHLRRAHIRRIAKDGKLIPVAAALVNWDGSPLMRTEYQVRS